VSGSYVESVIIQVIEMAMRPTQFSFTMQGNSLARPTLGPVGLQLRHLVGVGKSIVKVFEGGIGAGTVRVENVVVGFERDGL
jgi:hypothetical protein